MPDSKEPFSLTEAGIRTLVSEAIAKEFSEYHITIDESDLLPHADRIMDGVSPRIEGLINTGIESRVKPLEDKLNGEIERKLDGLRGILETAIKEKTIAPAKLAAAITTSLAVDDDDHVFKFLLKYASPGKSSGPILLKGDQGSGKTTAAKQFAERAGFDYVVVVGGQTGLEAMDFIGGLRPWDGPPIWQDGPITRAFRLAAAGYKVCLIVDELFRIKQRERSPFITGLSPYEKLDGIEYYQLETNRIIDIKDGIVVGTELIEAPVQNLTIIATTNVGADFDVDMGDPAEAERWLPFQLDSTEAVVKRILKKHLVKKGFPEALIGKFLNILKGGQKMKLDNFLALAPTVRTLTKAIKLSDTPADIKEHLKVVGMIWVGTSIEGKPIEEQVRSMHKLIDDNMR